MALSKMGISYVLPKAAFYLYCDFREVENFDERCLNEHISKAILIAK